MKLFSIAFIVIILNIFSKLVPIYGQELDRDASPDTLKSGRRVIFFLPTLMKTPETRWGGGGTLVYIYRTKGSTPRNRPSFIAPTLIYTQEKQYIANLSLDLYLKNDMYRLTSTVEFAEFPHEFRGIWSKKPADEVNEGKYTANSRLVSVNILRKFWHEKYFGISYFYSYYDMRNVSSDLLLNLWSYSYYHLKSIKSVGIPFVFDSRNNIWCPTSGQLLTFTVNVAREAIGSDFDYNRFYFDYRRYFPLTSRHIFAFQMCVVNISDDSPFYVLPTFGGESLMRGYEYGYYCDSKMLVFQSEYRLIPAKKWGLVMFANMGSVNNKLSNLSGEDLKYGGGIGLRRLINKKERINLCVDLGFGKGSAGIYLRIGEAF